MFSTLIKVRDLWLEKGPIDHPGRIDYINPNKYAWQTNLRFDFEYGAEKPYEEVVDDIMDKLVIEIMDLIYNGDVTLRADPLLNSMDGANKRKAYPTLIDFRGIVLIREYKTHKDMYEYTAYVGPYVEWEPNAALL